MRGITRDAVIAASKSLGYSVEERALTVHELYNADEVFVTGTAAELVPIVNISGRKIGEGKPGPIFSRILASFKESIKKSTEGTPINR